MAKTKVAVVGGGVSALAAVYALTSDESVASKYEVTVYQLGHRLGGKGASGRNLEAGKGKRIEEHGLHIWFGFYENAFKWMKDAYAKMDRQTGPIRTWDQAFHKHSYVVLMEAMRDGMQPWTFVFPENTNVPGDGGVLPTPLAYAEMAIEWLVKWLPGRIEAHAPESNKAVLALPDHVDDVVAVASAEPPKPRTRDASHGSFIPAGPLPVVNHAVTALLSQAHRVMRSLEEDVQQLEAPRRSAISWLIRRAMEIAWAGLGDRVDTDLEARKLWVAINLTGSVICGMIDDGVLVAGFDSIDRFDLREWLRRNGANETTTEKSGSIRGIYDLVFGFIGGDVKRGAFAAGTALRGVLRMLFTYKGSFMWRMEAGMGDIVATPFYEVLRQRGVRFEFFHRVCELAVEGDKVHRIRVKKQVKLLDESTPYQPLVDVEGVPCWPSRPLYDQIHDGAELEREPEIDLESSWSKPWKDEEELVLELGRDFDQVILAASIAALKDIAKPMLAASPALRAAVEGVLTTQTQALQLWLEKTTTALGWEKPAGMSEGPVLGAYYEPIDTWADMSDLLPRESWGPAGPQSIAYFCGPWIDAAEIAPYSDHAFPRREKERYERVVQGFMSEYLRGLWPSFADEHAVSRYVRVNIDPTERYVLSAPGTTELRLRAEQSGFSNVVLCGDWTQNGFNAGCVEAAVMGGLYASNALCGVPRLDEILGADRG